MASYLRNALAKAMSKYFKNIQPDLFTLSFFRGEAELNDLELRPEVLQHLLGFPRWLLLKKATIGSIRASVTWTKIKSQAIKITIDEMQIKLEATTTPDDLAEIDPELLAVADASEKKEKYGFIDAVFDGIMIEVNNIDISLHGPDFDGTVHIIHMVFESCTDKWESAPDLKYTRKENRTPPKHPGFRQLPPHVTLYKVLNIHQLRGWVSPATPRISEAASADPFIFSIDKPRIRIFKQKSLDDNSKVLSMHMTLDINLIKQELSRFQIQTLNHFVWSITRMMAATRGMSHDENELEVSADTAVGTDFGVHLKIKTIELSLKNHIHTLGQDDFLTSLHIHKVHAHHFAEKRVGTKLESNDAMRQAYLGECASWMKSVNTKWSKSSRMTKAEKLRLRQATTSIIVGQFEIATRPQLSTKDRAAQLKRGSGTASTDPGMAKAAAAAASSDAADSGGRIALLECNYDEFHLPTDLAILQLDIVSFFMLPDFTTSPARHSMPAAAASPDAAGAPADSAGSIARITTPRNSGRADSGAMSPNDRQGGVPPAATFGKLNPVKINLNLPAVLNLVEFANSCRLAAPAILGEASSATFEDLSVEISLCPSQDRMLPLWKQIEELATVAESAVSSDEIKELKRVYLMRMEELQLIEEAAAEEEYSEGDFSRYSIEVNLPTVVLPKRLDGPARVREIEMRFTVSRATITNAMTDSRFAGITDYDAFFESPLVTARGASQVDIPLDIAEGARTVQPLPRRSWLPRKGGDAPDVMHVQVDQVWGDVIDASGKKKPLMHRVGASIFVMDSSVKAKRALNSAVAKQVTKSNAGSPELVDLHPIFASSYTLVTITDPLRLELNNSSLMFLTRVSEEFTKVSSLMDDGSDTGHSFTFCAIDSITASLYAEKHMFDPATMTKQFIEEQGIRIGHKPFQLVDISKLHILSHNGSRVSTQLFAVEDVGLASNAFETIIASPSPIRGTDAPGSWNKVSLAIRMRSPLATAEHTYRFYQQLDAVLLEKAAGPQNVGGATAVETIERQGNLGQRRRSAGDAGPADDIDQPPDFVGSDMGPNLLYYLAAKKEGGPKSKELELHFLPRSEMKLEVRGLSLKTESNTVALLSALTDDYFPDDTFPPSAMHLTVIDTDVVLLDNATYEAKSREHFRLQSAEDTATNSYRLDGVQVVRDGNKWVISTGDAVKANTYQGVKEIKEEEKVSRLQSELASARELIAAQKLALEQAEATRASLLTALEEIKR